jgi:hypothetical protein
MDPFSEMNSPPGLDKHPVDLFACHVFGALGQALSLVMQQIGVGACGEGNVWMGVEPL